MQPSNTSTKIQEACTKWSKVYIEAYLEATGRDLSDLSQIGITNWSDQFIWLSTHCQVNIIIPQGNLHTFKEAQSSNLLNIYTMLIQHTFQILESFGISAPEASLYIPNFFNRHFDYFNLFISGQSNWVDTEKNDYLEWRWMSTRSIDFLASSTELIELNNPLHLWERGKEKRNNQDLTGAQEDFKKAVLLDPTNYMIFNSLGRTEFELENYNEADDAYSKGLDIKPDDALILRNRAECRNEAGRLQEALEDIKRSEEIEPKQFHTCMIRCEIHENLGNYGQALQDLTSWIEKDPENAFALYKRGEMHERLEMHKAAVDDFKASLLIKSEAVPALLGLANNYSKIGEDRLAIKTYLEVIEKTDSSMRLHAFNGIGNIYSSQDKFDESIKWFTKGIESHANESSSHQLYNVILFYNRGNARDSLGDKQGAIDDYSEGLSIDPNHLGSLQNRAATLQEINENEKAIQDYQKYLAIDPDNAFINCFLADLLADTGSIEEAIRYWSKAIELKNDYVEALYNRGLCYEQDLNKHELALADLSKAVELEPEDAQYREILADSYFSLEQYDMAIAEYTEAIKFDPSRLSCYRWRGFAHHNLEQYEEAISDLSNSISENQYFEDYEVLAECKLKINDTSGALLAINKLLEYIESQHDETFPSTAYKVRSAIYEAQGQLELSQSDKQKSLELELSFGEYLVEKYPDQAWCYSTRGEARAKLGDQEGAESDFCKARELNN